MTINFAALQHAPRLLMEAKLKPLQGHRFQSTGFADLGPARYTLHDGTEMLLVESVQSVANRLELACWDSASDALIDGLKGLPYIEVTKNNGKESLTNSMLEAHRINSPYIVANKDTTVFDIIKNGTGAADAAPVDIRGLAKLLLKYDANAVIHGVFLADGDLAGGRLRLPRLLSGFIEAVDVQLAESGGVKNDRVNPAKGGEGQTSAEGFGNVPFHRSEFTAREVKAYFNLDLAQLRGYGLGSQATELLIALSIFKVRRFLSTGLRLRTACDLDVDGQLSAQRPADFAIPDEASLLKACKALIEACAGNGDFAQPAVTRIEWKGSRKGGKKAAAKDDDE